jgi:hypothetical protein
VLVALDVKMIPSMQVDFSVSSQEAKAEETAGQYKEPGTFMMGGHQWKLHCYPRRMNDHQWMDVPDGIVAVLVRMHNFQMVHVSSLL